MRFQTPQHAGHARVSPRAALVPHNTLPAGTLQQAVVSEALASTLIAPGLLYATQAHTTADLRVVGAIALFVVRRGYGGAAAAKRRVTGRRDRGLGTTADRGRSNLAAAL